MKALPDVIVEGHEPGAVVLLRGVRAKGRMARSRMACRVSEVMRMVFMAVTARSGRPGHDCRPSRT